MYVYVFMSAKCTTHAGFVIRMKLFDYPVLDEESEDELFGDNPLLDRYSNNS